MSTFDKEEFPREYINAQANIVGECMINSAKLGIDSDDFAEKLMTSDYGVMVMTDRRMIEYSCANFMLEGFTREMKFKKGGHYDADTLWMAGYLYKYWTSTRHADTREIYKIAPIRKLAIRYNFYHTQGFEYIIEDLIDRQDCPLMNDKELEKILKTEEAI